MTITGPVGIEDFVGTGPAVGGGFSQGSAIGGTITDVEDSGIIYREHRFTSSDTLVVTGKLFAVQGVVTAGGGAGMEGASVNFAGGGGGGGGVLEFCGATLEGEIDVVVGAGGSLSNGSDSSIGDYVAIGGGRGGNSDFESIADSGGSGGGAGARGFPGDGVDGQGNRGGNRVDPIPTISERAGGGGGGAASVGGDASPGIGGDGGLARETLAGFRGAGGGGAGGGGSADPKAGGAGNNGSGDGATDEENGGNGQPNTGGGGGGCRRTTPGTGGSGEGWIRYPIGLAA